VFGGGLLFRPRASLYGSEVAILGNTAWDTGAGLACDGASVRLDNNTRIVGNVASPGLTSAMLSALRPSTLSQLPDVVRSQNYDGTGEAGGLLLIGGSVAVCANMSISRNDALSAAGFKVSGKGTKITMQHCDVSENIARELAGGFYALDNAEVILESSAIIHNGAIYDGGAAYLERSTVQVHGGRINSNQADRGGALFCSGGSSSSLLDVEMALNTATDSAGGVYLARGSTFEAEAVDFLYNQAGSVGGGAMRAARTHVELYRCSFTGNTAVGGKGGALQFTSRASVRVRSCDFLRNWATSAGGAMAVMVQGSAEVEWTTFFGNSASGTGGAVFVDTASYNAIFVQAAENRAPLGGAIAAVDSIVTLTDSVVSANVASEPCDPPTDECDALDLPEADGNGGSVHLSEASTFVAEECAFRANNALRGGALFLADTSRLNATKLRIEQNEARVGGGLYFVVPSEMRALDDRSVIANNIGNDVATGSSGIEIVTWPNLFQPGVSPFELEEVARINVVDVLGQISAADSETECVVTSDRIVEQAANLLLKRAIITSVDGIVDYSEQFAVLGTIGTHHNMTVSCSVGEPIDRLPVEVGPCHPGSALSGSGECTKCRMGTYSSDGRSCLAVRVSRLLYDGGGVRVVCDIGVMSVSHAYNSVRLEVCASVGFTIRINATWWERSCARSRLGRCIPRHSPASGRMTCQRHVRGCGVRAGQG
jgi:hypothetical protein